MLSRATSFHIFSYLNLTVLQNGQHLTLIGKNSYSKMSSHLFKVISGCQKSNMVHVVQELVFFPVPPAVTQNGNKENNNNNGICMNSLCKKLLMFDIFLMSIIKFLL